MPITDSTDNHSHLPKAHNDSWMYESSGDDSNDEDRIVWDESNNQISDESYLEEFESERQAEAYVEYAVPGEEEVIFTTITPTKKQLRLWAFLILASNYHENQDQAEAEKLVLDVQQIACLRKYVGDETRNDSRVKDMDAELERQSKIIDVFERKMKELGRSRSHKVPARKSKHSAQPKGKPEATPCEYTKEITDQNEIKSMILKKIVDDMMLLDKDLIWKSNKVDLYDLSSLRNMIIDASKLALLIQETLVGTDNNGLPMWCGKNNTKLCFGEEEVDVIEFIPVGKVFQTYKMAISYKYSPKFKPAVAQLNMSVILDAVVHLVNHKSADVHPYGPFDAHRNDPRVFNLFSGLPHVYDPEYVINQKRVDVWLDHIKYVLSDSNDTVYQFFVKYFAHLIQKPHVKTKMVPLIKGTQGCGKNSSFDIFHRFVIGPQNCLVCPSMERITARFNSIRQSKLSIVLDEAFDSNNRSMNNQMKSYITDDRTQIERKGLETIEVNDYANYVILTNNDFGSIIGANDRRYMCLVASECRVGDEKYFDHYFDTLANIDAGRDIFHYLARVDLTGFKPQSFPLTKYKKELKAKQTNNVVKCF